MDLFIPSNSSFDKVAPTITHLGIGAHQDDLEIMALPGILECYQNPKKQFGGITCTAGGGSPRSGPYTSYSDEEMKVCRRQEQHQAAILGEYALMIQLDYTSLEIQEPTSNRLLSKLACADEVQGVDSAQKLSVQKLLDASSTGATKQFAAEVELGKKSSPLVATLQELLCQMRPQIIYTHHLADKHPTHRAVCFAVIEALRQLPREQRPTQLLGGEVWRGLDWLSHHDKIALDVSAHPELSEKLLTVFDSQIAGGKRYDLATLGRRRANATYSIPHEIDQAALVSYAMDLSPLIENDQLDVVEYTLEFIDRFRSEVEFENKDERKRN